MKNVLFLCTGNSCRSQIAEAWVNDKYSDKWQAFSAGTSPTGKVHPLAIKSLMLSNIIHNGISKHVDSLSELNFNLVVIVCDDANENCPVWLREGTVVHIPFNDPAKMIGSEDEKLIVFNRVRDEIIFAINNLLLSALRINKSHANIFSYGIRIIRYEY